MTPNVIRGLLAALAITLSMMTAEAVAQGLYVSAGGPVHRGMGGASTAAPINALGALYWNPATISGLQRSELEFGLDLLLADHTVSSSLGPFAGSTSAEPGAFPIPNVGWVHQPEGSRMTFGLGVNAIAGFKTNLPADPNNPALAPPGSPPGVGLGRVTSEASFLQLSPVLSVALTENLSVAAGPLVTMGQIGIEPFVFDTPNMNDTYSSGRASRYHWGGGAQVGVYYVHNYCWHLGASVKSPVWMEEFRFFSSDENGEPRVLHSDVDLPLIVSLGAAYSGRENWLFALDVRYFDYENTDGLGDPAVFDTNATLSGLDWSSVLAVAFGAQRRINDRLYLRAGYSYNQNPIKNSEAFFNMASPLIYEHILSAGASYNFCESTSFSVAYSYYANNTRTGPVVLPRVGSIGGSSVTNELSAHFISFGVVMRH